MTHDFEREELKEMRERAAKVADVMNEVQTLRRLVDSQAARIRELEARESRREHIRSTIAVPEHTTMKAPWPWELGITVPAPFGCVEKYDG